MVFGKANCEEASFRFFSFVHVLCFENLQHFRANLKCFSCKYFKNLLCVSGPYFRFPIIGHLHLLGKKTHLALTSLQKKYGDVFTMRIGPHQALVISGKESIKSACCLEPLYGRPHKFFNSWQKHDRYGRLSLGNTSSISW